MTKAPTPKRNAAQSSVAPLFDPLSPFRDALRSLIQEAMQPCLDEIRALVSDPAVDYRDRHQEAKRLGISVSTLDRECREGLPFVYVGDSRRFRAADVDAWLRSRTSAPPELRKERRG